MTRRIVLPLLAALVLAGCGGTANDGKGAKRYPMQGEVKALDARAKSATIDAGKIGDWMEAMTMEYPVKPDTEFDKLHVGDKIEATVVVSDLNYYVTEVKVAGKQ
jgi:Cu/Ag efflux protein CusF